MPTFKDFEVDQKVIFIGEFEDPQVFPLPPSQAAFCIDICANKIPTRTTGIVLETNPHVITINTELGKVYLRKEEEFYWQNKIKIIGLDLNQILKAMNKIFNTNKGGMKNG